MPKRYQIRMYATENPTPDWIPADSDLTDIIEFELDQEPTPANLFTVLEQWKQQGETQRQLEENSSITPMLDIVETLEDLKGIGSTKFGEIFRLQQDLTERAKTARERILKHAIAACASSGIGVNAGFVRTYVKTEPETRVLYVGSLYWRDCDSILSVAGFDHNAVSHKLAELAEDELEEAVDADMIGAEDGTDAGDVRDNLETELCSTGVNQFAYPADLDTLGIDAEHAEELTRDQITIY